MVPVIIAVLWAWWLREAILTTLTEEEDFRIDRRSVAREPIPYAAL